MNLWPVEPFCSTGQRFICIEVTSYKIHTLDCSTDVYNVAIIRLRLWNFQWDCQHNTMTTPRSSTMKRCGTQSRLLTRNGRYGNGILLQKLFWPTVRINCSSDWEKLLKFEAEGREFARFFLTVGQNNFGNKIPFLILWTFCLLNCQSTI